MFPFIVTLLFLQDVPETPEKEVVVTATREEADTFDLPFSVDSINRNDLLHRSLFRSLPEALRETAGIMVQKTGQGQGSPFLRGFTGFRTLMLIDGIRLNNSVFRDGPNQYWNTVDPFSIDRLEVVRGPSSVLYSSDAIGGTVNAITIRPDVYQEEGVGYGGRWYNRYGSADNSYTGRGEWQITSGKRFGLIMGETGRIYHDLRAGDPVGEQPNTGYEDYDFDLKSEYWISENVRLVGALQSVTIEDAWRTHKTTSGFSWEGTTVGNERERSFDQARQLAYLQLHAEELDGFVDTIRASLSWHGQEEERFRLKAPTKGGDRQGFDVGTLGLWAQFETELSFGRLTYGIEWYHDEVDSFKDKLDDSGAFVSSSIQGPVSDDASYDLAGVYLQATIPAGEKWEFIAGSRFTYAQAEADKFEDPVTSLESSLKEDWTNLSGSLRVLYSMSEEIHLFGGVSQGFRAPNLSDLTRLDTARSNEIETPSPGLEPEDFVAFELGAKTLFESWEMELSLYYTLINDMIIRRPTGTVIDGDFEVTKENAGDGTLWGGELALRLFFSEEISAFATLGFVRGEVDQYPTSSPDKEREPLSRMMPLTVQLGLRWEPSEAGYWVESLATFADEQDELSSRDESDTQRIPPGGTPSYAVFTLRGGYRFNDHINGSATLENIFDEDYRIHGSGVNEAGVNFVAALDLTF